jgi:hypothetical protein
MGKIDRYRFCAISALVTGALGIAVGLILLVLSTPNLKAFLAELFEPKPEISAIQVAGILIVGGGIGSLYYGLGSVITNRREINGRRNAHH